VCVRRCVASISQKQYKKSKEVDVSNSNRI